MSQNKFLIIGGLSGIGERTVQLLSDRGHTLITASRRSSTGSTAHIQYDALLDEFPTASLPEKLDGLVYCPGSINLKPFHRISDAEFRSDFELNVMGAIRTIRACLPHLRAAGQASVVLFSTVAVRQGMPYHASVATAKAAIEGLTISLAAELAPVVRVNCIAPSLTDTPMASRLLSTDEKKKAGGERHPMRRVGTVDDLAAATVFLLSNDSSWITGQTLPVDGGLSTLRVS